MQKNTLPLEMRLNEYAKLVNLIGSGKITVIPTDTIYGIVGSALNPQTVEKIYQIRKRAKDKPFIILISSLDDLKKFDIKLNIHQRKFLQKNWPNPLSVVLPCPSEKFKYLHRGAFSLAFRMPKDINLLGILKKVGPMVAPSANFEGGEPAETISEAKTNFKDAVSVYVDGGKIKSKPSTIIQLNDNGSWKILRYGKYGRGRSII